MHSRDRKRRHPRRQRSGGAMLRSWLLRHCWLEPKSLLGRVTEEKTALIEISILRHDDKPLLRSILPDTCIDLFLQSNFADVPGGRIFLLQHLNKAMGEILIEEKLHDGGIDTSFRSRSAAKARQARMSSLVRSGKIFENFLFTHSGGKVL